MKYVKIFFCDWGGSSMGVRETLKSDNLVKFVRSNPHLKFEFYLKRNNHPYLESVYLNGYVKEQSLRNMEPDKIMEWMGKVN